LGLLFPWAVVPSHIGFATGGWSFFLEWLTKYPNFGPINLEVGLGILFVVVCSLLPFGFGAYLVFAKTPRRRVLVMLLVAELVFFLPVLTQLDIGMWMSIWWVVLAAFAPDPSGHPPWFPGPWFLWGYLILFECIGAILRATVLTNMCIVILLTARSNHR
jgi:hypothetical protein